MYSYRYIVLFLFSLFVISPDAFTQEDQLFYIHEEVAKTDRLADYNETSRQWLDMAHAGQLDVDTIRVSQTDDNHFFYLMKIKNFAEIDGVNQKFAAAREKYGKENWRAFLKKNDATIKASSDYILRWSGKYSYVPKERRLKFGEAGFTHFDYIYYKPENREEVMDIIAKWKEIYTKAGINNQYNVWFVEVGRDNNLIIITESAKDEIEYYTMSREVDEKLGAELNPLWYKLLSYCTDFEHKNGRPRYDLAFYKNSSAK